MASMVKANAPSTPVILLTDWAGQVDMKDLPVHADCVLSKPPRIPELRQRMALLCNPPTPDANASR
jgi:guanylate kinase